MPSAIARPAADEYAPYYETYLKSAITPLEVSGMRVHSVAEIEAEIVKIAGLPGIASWSHPTPSPT